MFDRFCAQLRVLGQPVGHDRLGDRGHDIAYVDIVGTQHCDAVERKPLNEVDERPRQLAEVMAVRLHVIGIDVGHHGDHRCQIKERSVGFVSLCDEIL